MKCVNHLPEFETFFNISVSYREDADVKNVYYGLVERVKSIRENLTDIIDQFGANNKQLANKSPKESQTYIGNI